MKRWWWKVVAGVVGLGILVMIGILVAPKNPVLPSIRKQLTSALLLPKGGGVAVDAKSVKYDATNKLLTYNVAYAGTKIVMSEQPTPDQFVDIPAVYTKLIDGMNNYQSFDASVGTVHLTKPPQLGGKQAAVLNTKGTLLFAKPDKNLTNDQWRIFFNSLTL